MSLATKVQTKHQTACLHPVLSNKKKKKKKKKNRTEKDENSSSYHIKKSVFSWD